MNALDDFFLPSPPLWYSRYNNPFVWGTVDNIFTALHLRSKIPLLLQYISQITRWYLSPIMEMSPGPYENRQNISPTIEKLIHQCLMTLASNSPLYAWRVRHLNYLAAHVHPLYIYVLKSSVTLILGVLKSSLGRVLITTSHWSIISQSALQSKVGINKAYVSITLHSKHRSLCNQFFSVGFVLHHRD